MPKLTTFVLYVVYIALLSSFIWFTDLQFNIFQSYLNGVHFQPSQLPAPNLVYFGNNTEIELQEMNGGTIYQPGKKFNVVFILVDDLRVQMGELVGREYKTSFQQPQVFTPNIDKLIQKSLVLSRTYSQYSLCGPSRVSLLTSRIPDTTKVYDNKVDFKIVGDNFITLPQYFKEHGYESVGFGKIFHTDGKPDPYDEITWSRPHFIPNNIQQTTTLNANWMAVDKESRTKEPLEDDQIIHKTVDYLKDYSHKDTSSEDKKYFFAAVGLYRPHVPCSCPKEFYDMYPLEEGDFLLNASWHTPKLTSGNHLAPFQQGIDNSKLGYIPKDTLREMRRSYFACVSYIDNLIGKLIDALKTYNLEDTTVISLISDHGYHLGENSQYSKYTLHEASLHVPFILRIPGVTDRGIESKSLVQLTDVFPTVVQAAGLKSPEKCPQRSDQIQECTDGISMIPLINNPQQELRDATFSQLQNTKRLFHYSMRTDRYRISDFGRLQLVGNCSDCIRHEVMWDVGDKFPDRELYDHSVDPEEAVNLFNDLRYTYIKLQLLKKLHEQFTEIYNYTM